MHSNRRHESLIELQIDRVELALPCGERAVGREHPRDVRLVVLVVGRVVELHQIAVGDFRGVLVVVRIDRVRAGRDEREVRRPVRAVLLEHVLRFRLQLVLEHPRLHMAHRLDNREPRDARRLADDGDFAGALRDAKRIEDRIEIPDGRLRRRGLQLCDERVLTRDAAVPRIVFRRAPQRRRIAGRRLTQNLWTERRVDRPSLFGERRDNGAERLAIDDVVHADCAGGIVARMQRGTEHPRFAPLVVRLQKDRRLFRARVDDGDRTRLGDAGHVEELIVLPERLLAGPLGRPLQNRDAVANLCDHARTPRGEFFGRKDLRAGEYRLSRRHRPGNEQNEQPGDQKQLSRSHAPVYAFYNSLTYARSQIRDPSADRAAGVFPRRDSHAGPRHRRQHIDLHRRQRRAAAAVAVSRSGAADAARGAHVAVSPLHQPDRADV